MDYTIKAVDTDAVKGADALQIGFVPAAVAGAALLGLGFYLGAKGMSNEAAKVAGVRLPLKSALMGTQTDYATAKDARERELAAEALMSGDAANSQARGAL